MKHTTLSGVAGGEDLYWVFGDCAQEPGFRFIALVPDEVEETVSAGRRMLVPFNWMFVYESDLDDDKRFTFHRRLMARRNAERDREGGVHKGAQPGGKK